MALAARQQVRQPTEGEHGACSTELDSPPAAHDAKRMTSFLDSDSTTSDEAQDSDRQLNSTVQQEVLMYFGEHPISKKENLLTWWKKNTACYPTMALVTRSLLCIPATSTPLERLFSAAGNIASRANLSPEHADLSSQQ